MKKAMLSRVMFTFFWFAHKVVNQVKKASSKILRLAKTRNVSCLKRKATICSKSHLIQSSKSLAVF